MRAWLGAGVPVILNGSRGALPRADTVFGERLVPVLVDAAPEVIMRRLESRGRESGDALRARYRRGMAYAGVDHPRLVRIDNSGALETAGDRLVALIAESDLAASRNVE